MTQSKIITFDTIAFPIDNSLLKLLHQETDCQELSHSLHKDSSVYINTNNTFPGNSLPNNQLLPSLPDSLYQLYVQAYHIAKPEAAVGKANAINSTIAIPDAIVTSDRSYAFIFTLGIRYENWYTNLPSITHQYHASIIGMWLCNRYVQELLKMLFGTGGCVLYPGSSRGLPVTLNHAIYAMLKTQAQNIGIALNQHCMFQPLHTVAGFALPYGNSHSVCSSCNLQQCQFRNILTELDNC